MDLSSFYALVSGTCFTLAGLWWMVVDRRAEWRVTASDRLSAAGVYLSFLLPALMSLAAQINPERAIFWRAGFVLAAVTGITGTTRLLAGSARSVAGRPNRKGWLAATVYALIGILGVYPDLVRPLGLHPLEGGAVLLICLILLAHGMTWEFLVERIPEPTAPSPRADLPEPRSKS